MRKFFWRKTSAMKEWHCWDSNTIAYYRVRGGLVPSLCEIILHSMQDPNLEDWHENSEIKKCEYCEYRLKFRKGKKNEDNC
jgi:hypothetical protein